MAEENADAVEDFERSHDSEAQGKMSTGQLSDESAPTSPRVLQRPREPIVIVELSDEDLVIFHFFNFDIFPEVLGRLYPENPIT